MSVISRIRTKNSNLVIEDVTSNKFRRYGRVINDGNYDLYEDYLVNETNIPSEGNAYIGDDSLLSKELKNAKNYKDIFGDMPLQFGYVNGRNSLLNSLEYHKSSEINIAITDLILMLGLEEDIVDNKYDSAKLEVFYIPKGTTIEIYPRVLHFSPCRVNDVGFKCGVILPKGTNLEFVKHSNPKLEEDYRLFKTNKWLISHKDHSKFVDLGSLIGIIGNNIEVKI